MKKHTHPKRSEFIATVPFTSDRVLLKPYFFRHPGKSHVMLPIVLSPPHPRLAHLSHPVFSAAIDQDRSGCANSRRRKRVRAKELDGAPRNEVMARTGVREGL